MDIVKTVADMQARSRRIRNEGKTIAFVPTMGFLHQGHMSLLDAGRNRANDLVLSIFVNPTQFAPGEDLDAYPKSVARDLAMAEERGVDAVFLPTPEQMYPEHYQTYVTLDTLPHFLCGLSRPTHFRGVATVVTKLFNIVMPHTAIFGEKDFQQLAVIRRMVLDLNMDIEIVGAPIVREEDGLAMSSRNSYLTAGQRRSALCLYKALQNAKKLVMDGERESATITRSSTEIIVSHPETAIDYLTICDPATLESVSRIEGPALFAMAVKVGNTRLIDNMILEP
ncbi:pantoate--beta-alanine ligase [Desulfatiferula olefinivorans]